MAPCFIPQKNSPNSNHCLDSWRIFDRWPTLQRLTDWDGSEMTGIQSIYSTWRKIERINPLKNRWVGETCIAFFLLKKRSLFAEKFVSCCGDVFLHTHKPKSHCWWFRNPVITTWDLPISWLVGFLPSRVPSGSWNQSIPRTHTFPNKTSSKATCDTQGSQWWYTCRYMIYAYNVCISIYVYWIMPTHCNSTVTVVVGFSS